jgi:hypothetical protein
MPIYINNACLYTGACVCVCVSQREREREREREFTVLLRSIQAHNTKCTIMFVYPPIYGKTKCMFKVRYHVEIY